MLLDESYQHVEVAEHDARLEHIAANRRCRSLCLRRFIAPSILAHAPLTGNLRLSSAERFLAEGHCALRCTLVRGRCRRLGLLALLLREDLLEVEVVRA